jgi:hypothetical protein
VIRFLIELSLSFLLVARYCFISGACTAWKRGTSPHVS